MFSLFSLEPRVVAKKSAVLEIMAPKRMSDEKIVLSDVESLYFINFKKTFRAGSFLGKVVYSRVRFFWNHFVCHEFGAYCFSLGCAPKSGVPKFL